VTKYAIIIWKEGSKTGTIHYFKTKREAEEFRKVVQDGQTYRVSDIAIVSKTKNSRRLPKGVKTI